MADARSCLIVLRPPVDQFGSDKEEVADTPECGPEFRRKAFAAKAGRRLGQPVHDDETRRMAAAQGEEAHLVNKNKRFRKDKRVTLTCLLVPSKAC